MGEQTTPPEPGEEGFWMLTLRQEEPLSLEEYDALVTFPVRSGEATAVFPSAQAAGPALASIRRNNPGMEVNVILRDSDWLVDALEHRADIDSVVTNASSVVASGGDIAAVSRRRFIEMLREGVVVDALLGLN